MAECAKGVYRPRRPRETPRYRIVEEHYERFEQIYPERYEDRYGYFRPVIRETVYKYLKGLEKQPLGPIPLSDDAASAKVARGTWARFIKKVFELDPLLCPGCGRVMKIIAFIE